MIEYNIYVTYNFILYNTQFLNYMIFITQDELLNSIQMSVVLTQFIVGLSMFWAAACRPVLCQRVRLFRPKACL